MPPPKNNQPDNHSLSRLQQFEELTEASFLIPNQVPGLSEHPLNHALRLTPISTKTRRQEFFARTRSGAVSGNDLGYHGRQVVDELHGDLADPLNGIGEPNGCPQTTVQWQFFNLLDDTLPQCPCRETS